MSPGNTLTFMTQWGRKYQPYRGGSGAAAYQYLVESTARQDSRTEIGKVDYMRVINNRATLDTSVNVFGTQFPLTAHTDKTPIIDDVTFARSGAYNTPSLTEDRRWHYNTNLTLYADRHDMKIGYMYQRYAPRFTAYGAPGPAGTVGHFYIATTNGVPSSFWTDNGPVSSVNTLKNHALFFQDKFQVTSKLTLNYGIRFDQYRSAYPEQRFGLNGDLGPFAVATVAPAQDVVTFNTLVPRVARHLRRLRRIEDGPEGQLGPIRDESGGRYFRARESDRPHHQEVRVGQHLPDGGSRGRRHADHAGLCRDAAADLRRRATDAGRRRSEL